MSNTALIHGPLPETNYLYKNVVVKGNFPLASLLVHPDTKYTIKHNFDLEGQTIELPPNCILAIDGGMLYNGTLVGDNSILIDVNRLGNVLDNVIQTGTWKKQDVLNSLSIGTVISGDEPQVTITGEDGDAILNFVLPKGDKGNQGDIGDPFTYEDFTLEQLEGLIGPQGPLGKAFEYSDFTQELLESIRGPLGILGPKGVSILSFTKIGELGNDLIYNTTFDDGSAQIVNIPKGEKGDLGPQGDCLILDLSTSNSYTLYNVTGQNTDGAMTQKAVTDSLTSENISYNNILSGLAANNMQAGLDEVTNNLYSYEKIDWVNKTTSLAYYISGNTATLGQWAKQNSYANYYCRILPIDNNTKYVITASDNNPAHIALLTNNTTHEGDIATDWNEGNPKRINAGESMVIDSGNYSYLYFRNNVNSTSSDFKNPKRIETRKSVNEVIEALSEVTDALGVDIKENEKHILDVESKLYPYLDNVPEVNYAFSVDTFGKDTSYKHAAIPVSVGEEYIIESPNNVSAFYCFATSNVATSDNPIPFIEGVTSATGIGKGNKVKVVIPNTCTYLLVYNTSNTRPFLIKKESILKKVRVTLGYDYITASGDFGQHQSNFESGQFHATPRFIKISEPFICKFNQTGRLRVFFYDSEFNRVGYTNYPTVTNPPSPPIEANTDIFVNENSFKYSYVKFLFDTEIPFNNGKSLEVEAEVRGNLDDNWDIFNVMTSTYHRICVMVNVSDARCSDGITVVNPQDTPEEKQAYLQDSVMMKPNYGVIALPTTYSNTGKPTRLIIYCHGSGTHFTFSNSTGFNTSEHVDTKYWRKEGYAVMDIDGNPMNSSSHAFRPQAMSAYIAAYKWAIEHYNLCRDGVLLGGRSMGAGTVMYLLRGTCPIPVIAACANHPTSVAMGKTASSKSVNAELRGFILPEGFTFSDGPMTDEETQVFYDNWDRSMRYVPSLALCVDVPTTEEWRKNFIKNCCHVNERNDPKDYEGARIAACKDLHMVVRAPLKMFACIRDPNNDYRATSQLYMTMLGNAGQQAELRLFDSNHNNYADHRSEHYYELADPNLRTTFTTVYGEEVTDVPVVYIEMLQFWRRYEQNM